MRKLSPESVQLLSQCFVCVSGGGDLLWGLLAQGCFSRATSSLFLDICFFNPFLPFSAVNRERHFSCEDCNGHVSGGFDASVSQVGIFVMLFSFLQFS